MKILKRLVGIPLFFIAMAIMIIPYFFIWFFFGSRKANLIMDFVMMPILELTD